MNELALFAGAGGGLLGSKLLGWSTVCAVEIEKFPRKVLMRRQQDGTLEKFPIWDDVKTFDGKPWKGIVDVITGGFPCQDVSTANQRQNGAKGVRDGKRSGLWKEFARIIGEVGPSFVFAENSPLLVTRGLDIVLSDFAAMGYDVRWGVLGAGHVDLQHERERIWIFAWNDKISYAGNSTIFNLEIGRMVESSWGKEGKEKIRSESRKSIGLVVGVVAPEKWKSERFKIDPRSLFVRSDNGVAHGLDRHKAIGNGQVPVCMATAFLLLSKGIVW